MSSLLTASSLERILVFSVWVHTWNLDTFCSKRLRHKRKEKRRRDIYCFCLLYREILKKKSLRATRINLETLKFKSLVMFFYKFGWSSYIFLQSRWISIQGLPRGITISVIWIQMSTLSINNIYQVSYDCRRQSTYSNMDHNKKRIDHKTWSRNLITE